MASTSKAFNKCVDPCPRYLRWHTQSLRLLFGQGARTRCPWGENLCATSSTFASRRHMIGKVVTGCVAILPYHTATQDRGSECRDFGFISRIVTALLQMFWAKKCNLVVWCWECTNWSRTPKQRTGWIIWLCWTMKSLSKHALAFQHALDHQRCSTAFKGQCAF